LTNRFLNLKIRHPAGLVTRHLESIFPATACTSIVVSAEIRYGLNKTPSQKLNHQAMLVLAALDILPLKPPVDEHYGEIRAYLNRTGQPIGWNDLFIAAHARALELTLVTANVREFSRVPGLHVENWLLS